MFNNSRKSRKIASKRVKNTNMILLASKIIFSAIFFNTTIEFVVSELKRNKKLRKFFKINDDVPNAVQVSEFISRFKPDTYVKISNSILIQTEPLKRGIKLTFIVSTTRYKNFTGIMEKIQKRRLIQEKDIEYSIEDITNTELTNRNFQYKIVPLIFTKENSKSEN